MSRRTHRELAVGSYLISESQRKGDKETKAGEAQDKERKKTSELGAGRVLRAGTQ